MPAFRAADVVSAAVSYVGGNADELVALKRGDRLVFDGSDAALQSGLANPDVLERWSMASVELRSLGGLHAKVLVVEPEADGPLAYVGSMNLSHHSNDRLEEAFVVMDEPAAVTEVREWVEGLLARGTPVTAGWIKRARSIYRPSSVPKPHAAPHELLNLSGRVWLTHLDIANGEFGAATVRALDEAESKAGSLSVEAVDTTSAERSRVDDVWLVSFPGADRNGKPVSGNTLVRALCVVRQIIREGGRHSDIVVWAPDQQLTSPQRLSVVRAHLGVDARTDTYLVPPSEVPGLFDLLGVKRP
ncbi:hypothetical protein GCM10009858_44430 [Terrabacter carboxydivorans]|uniref:PLD phosphodiesterase domain-containing protein n=1 Tax=Terrabacter carboxydivorans TaxID=619730 RepID=A0ABP5ZS57_9MICO